MKRIGILGGTFNPIHIGHLAIAQVVADKLKLDKVIFVPSNRPPHKPDKNILNAQKRLQMVRLAVRTNSKFGVSDFEVKRPGKSFSIHTVRFLKSRYGKKAKFYFIIGTDVSPTLHTWKKINELTKLVSFVAVSRKGYKKEKSKMPFHRIETDDLGVSSSSLRKRLKAGQSTRYLIPDGVLNFIKKNRLYTS